MSPGETHKTRRGPFVIRPKDRIFLVNIFPKNDRNLKFNTVFRQDHMFCQDRIFYFSGPYILFKCEDQLSMYE